MRRVVSPLLLALAPLCAVAQPICPSVNLLQARTVNLKPSATSHIDVVRQSDGSYTGFEVADAPPYRIIAATPHFEKQFGACLPHRVPGYPPGVPPVANPAGAGSQFQVAEAVGSGRFFTGRISDDLSVIHFDLFDSQHSFVSETDFSHTASDGGFPRTDYFQGMTLADLNGDGIPDLIAAFDSNRVLASIQGGVWIFPGNGDGTFRPGTRTVLRTNTRLQAAFAVAVADVNGDGRPDVLLTGYNPANISVDLVVAWGNGDGTLNPRTTVVSGLPGSFVALADLNGDGKVDLVAGRTGAVSVATGNGDGSFRATTDYPVLPLQFPDVAGASVAVGDVNGDGIPDLVTASGTILFGDGRGGFPSRADYSSVATGSVMLGDIDGDGRTDIVFGNGNPTYLSGRTDAPGMTVLFGAGGGTFAGAPVSGVALAQNGPNPTLFVTADFDGDGFPDVVLATQTRDTVQLSTLQGQGNGRFVPLGAQVFAKARDTDVTAAIAADFNHDGKQDIALLLSAGGALLYPGRGDGSFGAAIPIVVPDVVTNFIAAPDLNGDGIPDLVIWGDSALFAFIGKGDGSFSSPTLTVSVQMPVVAFGDFNGDGKLDIAFANAGSATVRILPGRGDGTFSNTVTSSLPGPALGSAGSIGQPNSMAAADFDGDGRLDLAVMLGSIPAGPLASGSFQIAVLSGTGNGSFSAVHLSPGLMTLAVPVDINRDGIPDLVGYSNAGVQPGGLSVRLGNGDGTFQRDVLIQQAGPGQIAITDLNLDGLPDVMGMNASGAAAFLDLSAIPPAFTVVSAASFASGPLAPNSIAAAFGRNLAQGTVSVTDSAGVNRAATVLYGSAGQINFLVPSGAAIGPATVMIGGTTGQVQIAAIAPALFTVGANIAAGWAVRVAPGGAQTVAPVFAPPIDVSQPGQAYLVLLGTGFDAADLRSAVATVQGVTAQVTYAGKQSTFAGVDQVNLLLPASLAGAGVVTVSVAVGGLPANEVSVRIQ